MNIITFDTEEWYINKVIAGRVTEMVKVYDSTLGNLLDVLDQHEQKATFFCLGKLATDFPYVVRRIADRGHEIGCHSNIHTWLNKMTDAEIEEDTRSAVGALEDLTGRKVKSYRAPAFSITQANKHHLQILAKYGIENDCSIFPTGRDFGGYPSFPSQKPCTIQLADGQSIKEYPISFTHTLGRDLVFSGGGYFRLIPYVMIKRWMRETDYMMFYFHLADLIKDKSKVMTKEKYEEYFKEEGTLVRRYVRHFKTNVGRQAAWEKFLKVLDHYQFVNVETATAEIDWANQPLIQL